MQQGSSEDYDYNAGMGPLRRRKRPPVFVLLIVLVVVVGLTGRLALEVLSPPAQTPTPVPTEVPVAVLSPTEMVVPTGVPTQTLPLPTRTLTEPVTITYWDQEGDDGEAVLDELAAGFESANPGVTIKRVHFANEDLREQFAAAALTDRAPDLVRGPHDFVGSFSALPILLPIVDVFEPAFLDSFYSGALSAAIVTGTLWAIPDNYGNQLMLIYNEDLVKEVPAGTDAWIEQLKTLTSAGDGQYGLVYNLNEPFWLMPWVGGFGGWPLGDEDQPQLGSKAMQSALKFVHDLRYVAKVIPAQADYDTADSMFKQGKAAYIINGPWSLDDYKAAGFPVGIAPLPRVSATGLDPSPMTGGKYWFLSSDLSGLRLEVARRFVEYMTGAEAQDKWLETLGRLPSNKQSAQSDAIKDDPLLAGAMAQLARGRGIPSVPAMYCAWDAMRSPLEGVMAGELSPVEASQQMQDVTVQCMQADQDAAP